MIVRLSCVIILSGRQKRRTRGQAAIHSINGFFYLPFYLFIAFRLFFVYFPRLSYLLVIGCFVIFIKMYAIHAKIAPTLSNHNLRIELLYYVK